MFKILSVKPLKTAADCMVVPASEADLGCRSEVNFSRSPTAPKRITNASFWQLAIQSPDDVG